MIKINLLLHWLCGFSSAVWGPPNLSEDGLCQVGASGRGDVEGGVRYLWLGTFLVSNRSLRNSRLASVEEVDPVVAVQGEQAQSDCLLARMRREDNLNENAEV